MKQLVMITMAALLAGCRPAPTGRVVHTRLDNLLYAQKAPIADSTADFPRDAIASDTRPVLSADAATAAPGSFEHARVTLDIPSDAQLELAYGTRARLGQAPSEAEFRVTLATGGSQRVLLQDTVRPGEAGATAWKEATIPLPAATGATLTFTTTVPSSGPVSIAQFAAPVVTVPSSEARPRNVILVSLDTLRADHLGIYGYRQPTSPQIDRLFSTEGVVVDRVFSQGANTTEGHLAMLHGMLPTTVAKPVGPRVWHSKAVLSLAEILRAHGYRTAGFTEDALVDGPAGFNRGFDDAYHEEMRSGDKSTGHAAETFDRGLAWLAHHRDGPFFVFLHTYQVHNPYTPAPAFADRFPIPDGAGPAEHDRNLYDAEIAYTDDQVGRLVKALDELGLRDDTLLIITADHGEEFGEHGRRYHGTHLTNEILHVPLFLRAPGLLPAGVRRDGPMALMDVLPTVLDLLGYAVPPDIQGRSFADHLRLGSLVAPRPILSEARSTLAETYGGIDWWYPPSFGVTLWPLRLVRIRTDAYDGVRYELYDLAADPGETHDLFAERAADVGALRTAVDTYEPTALAEQVTLERGLAAGPRRAAQADLDPAREEKLRALGYLR